MKEYPTFDELQQRNATRQLLEELQVFQLQLHAEAEMNIRYHGKAQAIAYGLQAWIDALEISLRT